MLQPRDPPLSQEAASRLAPKTRVIAGFWWAATGAWALVVIPGLLMIGALLALKTATGTTAAAILALLLLLHALSGHSVREVVGEYIAAIAQRDNLSFRQAAQMGRARRIAHFMLATNLPYRSITVSIGLAWVAILLWHFPHREGYVNYIGVIGALPVWLRTWLTSGGGHGSIRGHALKRAITQPNDRAAIVAEALAAVPKN